MDNDKHVSISDEEREEIWRALDAMPDEKFLSIYSLVQTLSNCDFTREELTTMLCDALDRRDQKQEEEKKKAENNETSS